jgi:hypothetical protein
VDDLDLDASLDTSVTVVEWGGGLVEGLTADRLEITIDLAGPGSGLSVAGDRASSPGSGLSVAGDRASSPGYRPDGPEERVDATGAPAGAEVPALDTQPRRVRLEGRGERWESADDSARLALQGGPEAI